LEKKFHYKGPPPRGENFFHEFKMKNFQLHLLIVAAMAASHALESDFRSYRIAASNLVKMATSPAKTNVIGNLCQRPPSEEQRTVCK
jgi:hypothetical protein